MSGRSEKTCALCGKSQTAPFAPFCSRRCADLDLGRWLKGGYVLPGTSDRAGPDTDEPPESE